MAANAVIALVLLAAPYWFEDSDRSKTPAPAASPAAPSCAAGEVPYDGGCFRRTEFVANDPACPDGVIAVPAGQDAVKCVPCESSEALPPLAMNRCAGILHERADAELNRVYGEIAAEFPAKKNALRDGEQAWIRSRDETCKKGSGTPKVVMDCLREETEKRITALAKMRDGWKKKKS